MSNLIVSGQPFAYPDPGTEPGWGEDATGWAKAVTDLLASLVTTGDILQTTFAVQNNISSAEDVVGMFFDSGTVRSAQISYSVYRVSNAVSAGVSEAGVITIVLNDTAASGQKWQMMQTKEGNAGIAFSIGDGGQFQYIATDMGALDYSGTLKFSAKVLNK